MPRIKGKQIATGADGIATANLVDGVLSADVSGRAKIADNFFDSATVTSKFASASIALDRLAETVIQADGGQAFTADQSMGGFKITNLGTPSGATDAATKGYVDSIASGLDLKASVRAATTAPLAANTRTGNVLTANANGALATIDGVALTLNDRVLVKDEATGANNGIYYVSALGDGSNPWTLTRTTDADENAEVTAGLFTFVEEGTTNADSGWVLTTNDPITVNTTALAFSQFSGAGQVIAGNGLTKTGNTLDVGAGAGIQVNTNDVEVIYGTAGSITTVNAGDTASAGVADEAARIDHQHAVSTGTPGTIQPDDAAAEGVATSLARSDHTHAIATDTPVDVGTANSEGNATSFARSNHVHRAPKPTTADKNLIPSATSGDESTSGLTIAADPALDGYVGVSVNGAFYSVGDGVKIRDCYFSADGGTTARAISAIAAGDTLYWNGLVAGFDLATSDRVSFHYEVF